MDLAVSAVEISGFAFLTANQPVVEKFKEAREGEPAEILINGKPVAEVGGESTPCASVSSDVPQSVEAAIEIGPPTACRHNVVVSGAPLVTLIF
jgi:uncharacterized Zn-binding protein involved in type VI secretion